MKVYRLLHKQTGLYYQIYKEHGVSNLGPKGKIYKKQINPMRDLKILIEDGNIYVHIKMTNGLYKKIKDKLNYKVKKKHLYPDMVDCEWNEQYIIWECYIPMSDFEIIENDI